MPFYCAAKDIFMTHFCDERVVSVCVVCTACICGVCGFAVCIFIWCACVCVWLSDLWIVSSCSLTMCASCWKMEPNSTMVLSMFCMVSARLWMYESFANTTKGHLIMKSDIQHLSYMQTFINKQQPGLQSIPNSRGISSDRQIPVRRWAAAEEGLL